MVYYHDGRKLKMVCILEQGSKHDQTPMLIGPIPEKGRCDNLFTKKKSGKICVTLRGDRDLHSEQNIDRLIEKPWTGNPEFGLKSSELQESLVKNMVVILIFHIKNWLNDLCSDELRYKDRCG